MKYYLVHTPILVWPEYIGGMLVYQEEWRDVYLIEAKNRKEALWEAWRLAKMNRHLWYTENKTERVHPLSGATADEILFTDIAFCGHFDMDYTNIYELSRSKD